MRRLLAVLVLVATFFGIGEARLHSTQASGTVAVDVADLQDQLEATLKARRPEEFRFIAQVVHVVRKGRLPRSTVYGTMKWAKEKRAKFPFPYFQRAIRIRAAKLGVQL